ncbi:MAG: peptidoglycan D,D-transpeptidase FtsI family protein [Prochlorothrix sp.]
MVYRLFVLQVREAQALLEEAENQQYTQIKPAVPRRPILDRMGKVIALDQVRYTLYVHPSLFQTSSTAIAMELAPILIQAGQTVTPTDLVAEFSGQETGIRLADDLPESTAIAIQELGLDGLDLERYQERFYPNGRLFSQVIGYVNWEGIAQNGIEASEQTNLERHLPQITARRMGNGTLLPEALRLDVLSQDDLSLQLTLDSRLQQASQTILQAQLEKFSAKRGAVIIMDVHSGELITLVTLPTYDSNHYYEADIAHFRNWATSDLYEPGSTLKPLNVAIALQLGGIEPTDIFHDEGQIQVGGWPISNHDLDTVGSRGDLSVMEILKHSSNVGMVHIIQRLDPGKYYDSLQKIGLGQPMTTDLPHVATGYLKDRDIILRSEVDRATMAFGQGVTVTPMQMVQLHAALANGGKLVTPHVVKGLVDPQGTVQPLHEYETVQVFEPDVTAQVLTMMEAVVREGTSTAQIPGYRIGGKTGTAQKAEDGVYLSGAKITSFVGIVPMEAPQYAVFTVIDEPQGKDTFGSTVAAPVTRQVMETLTLLYGIRPYDPEVANRVNPSPSPSPEAVAPQSSSPDPEVFGPQFPSPAPEPAASE